MDYEDVKTAMEAVARETVLYRKASDALVASEVVYSEAAKAYLKDAGWTQSARREGDFVPPAGSLAEERFNSRAYPLNAAVELQRSLERE